MFDQTLISKNKDKSSANIKNSDFFQFIHRDLIDRLEPLDKAYNKILLIGSADIISNKFINGKIHFLLSHDLHLLDRKSFDLICFPFGLHWINDVQKFLLEVKSLLKSDGIFICNFPGSGSLSNLRKTLFLAEESASMVHFPHISPFIKLEDVTKLLQQAGFAENIIDYEYLSLEYDSPISLMKALRNVGESNAIQNRTNYSITKPMYKFLQNHNDKIFEDQVNLITSISSVVKHSIKLKPTYFFK